MSDSQQPPGHGQPPRHGWARILELGPTWITAIATLIVALTGIGFFAGRVTTPTVTPTSVPTPTQTVTKTVTAPPAPATSPNGGLTVYYQTSVGINNIGINFDNNPPSSASADITFNGSLSAQSPTILAVWPGSATPTGVQCENWVTTHPGGFVGTVTVGMQICLKTAQGRPGLLRIQSITSDVPTTANIQATVWQSPS